MVIATEFSPVSPVIIVMTMFQLLRKKSMAWKENLAKHRLWKLQESIVR